MSGVKKKEEKELIKEALRTSIKEGAANSVTTGLTANFITPFALKLSVTAGSFQVGLLNAIAGIVSPTAQLFGSRLMEKYHRKSIVKTFVLLQALTWLPLAVIAFLSYYNIANHYLVYALIFFYCLISAFSGIVYPSWFSWMGDIVPKDKRGKYFSRRNITIGIIELTIGLIAAFILTKLTSKGLALIGFALLFILSSIFRLVSLRYFRKQYIPHFREKETYHHSISEVTKGNKSFKRFALYQAFFNLALMIASPFFAVYMLRELRFDYFTFMMVSISSSAFYLAFTPLMGKISDKYGDVVLIYLANIFFVLSPVLWIFLKDPLLLMTIPQIVSGIANAAFVISFANFIYGSLDEEKRGVGVAYANLLAGLGTFIGSIIGGVLLSFAHISFMNKFIFIFILAAILRALVALIFLPGIKDGKKVHHLPHIAMNPLHPLKTVVTDIGWIKKVLK